MKYEIKDWKSDPDEIKFESGRIEINSEVQELMDKGLDVKHYLSRRLQGDRGYIDSGEHAYYVSIVDAIKFSKSIGLWEDPQ